MTQRLSVFVRHTALPLLLVFGLTRCALMGPSESFEHDESYKVTVPDGWTAVEKGEADRAYRTAGNSFATLTSSCVRPTDSTLDQLTRHLLMGLRHVKTLEKQDVTIGGETGQRTRVDATLDGKPVQLEVVVVRRGICVFDFSLMNRWGLSGGDRQAFQNFVRSIHFGKKRPGQ